MSLGDWLNSQIGGPTDSRETQDVAEIHKRLDSISRQMENISRAPGAAKGDPAVARQLNDAISRLDARLSQISERTPAPAYQPAPAYRPSPPIAAPQPQMDFSIAEIVARQGELDGVPRAMPPRAAMQMPAPSFVAPAYAPPMQPQADFSGLERQLSYMTSQIEQLRRPDPVMEQSIASFRSELADIRHAITEAMPRRAIETLETEVRSLGRRIDETRSSGVDGAALSGVERALAEIRGELRSLTPAEKLTGFDEAINNLGAKIDMIVRTSPDPGIIHQLEDAISALKIIVSNVASNDALHQLADHIQTLSAKVDQVAHSGGSEILSALEQRIATLTSAMETRERPATGDSSYFDNAVRSISDRLDHLQVGGDSASSFSHVEQRVHHLLERLENTDNRGGNLSRVEEGLSDVLRHLEQQRVGASDSNGHAAAAMDGGLVDTIKRELTDMRYSQSETDRHTQDSLEVVHSTLGHVVDRLAQIEGDLRDVRSAPPARNAPSRDAMEQDPRRREMFAPEPTRAPAPMPRPELPNPAAAQAPIARPVAASAPQSYAEQSTSGPSMADVAISGQHIAVAEASAAMRPPSAARNPIDPNLPPDTPLEPGTRPQQLRGTSTPSERIAASESALSEIPAGTREPVSSSNFIQAARRAAQAAATAPAAPAAGKKPNRVTSLNDAARTAAKVAATGESTMSSKIRALLVGASVVVIVLGTVKFGMNLLNGRSTSELPPSSESSEAAPLTLPSARDGEPRSDNVTPLSPSMTSPTPIDRQSMNGSVAPATSTAPAKIPAANAPETDAHPSPDVTGSIAVPQERISVTIPPSAPSRTKTIMTPVSDKIPEAIGGPALRLAANKGDPAAAFEIGIRYAEGKGVAVNYEEAAKWYERAAQGGIVPAIFRLGALHEKGLGTKKDVDAARRYYMQAAERGSAKAMHNLAVLDADGGSVGPNYKGAAQWFRKAAERGVADSQFNLAILYARGIGVEQNLAESFKWFSLAAAQGDAESGRKRDDVAKRLDSQSLAAARLAIQTFTPETQPEEATSVGAPAGGWDAAAAPKTSAKAAKTKSAAR
jgi:localization factor PodJL